ncbi:hypothetical protein, partial [Acinetobacter baumannii]|uniref:hypothetical protein n=1 Tax=Acinetobacter baumannii TaxID=470 RepID=UPI000FF0C33C
QGQKQQKLKQRLNYKEPVMVTNHPELQWRLGAFGVGLGISYLDFFLFFIGLLFLLCFFLALNQAREDAGSFPDE